jgi:putative MFS transporter
MIGLGLFFDAFDLYMASGVMVGLVASGWATMASNAHFLSAGALGALIGAFFAGWLGDRYGRKFTFQFNLMLFGVVSIAAALAPSMTWLIVLRFIMGLGLGAEIVVGYATISEFVPPATRGRWNAVLFFLSTSSLLISTALGYLIIPHLGWRWMFAIAGAGALVVWLMRKKMPESPRWLESVGRHAEADEIVTRIEAEVIRAEGRPLPDPEPVAAAPARIRHYRFGDLFRLPLLISTIVGVTLNVVGLAGVYGFIIWLPTFLMKRGLTLHSSLGYSALMATGSLIGIALAGTVSDRLGRRRGVVIMSLIAALLGWIYPQMATVLSTTLVGVLLTTALYFCGALGFSAYVPELFPTELRLRGCGIASVAGRAGSIVAPQLVSVLYAYGGGVKAVTLALIGLLLLQAAIVGSFGKETTNRSLDDRFDEPAAAPANDHPVPPAMTASAPTDR